MRILLTGAGGFIGSRLRAMLRTRGHEVVGVGRHGPADDPCWVTLDVAAATEPARWKPLLEEIDVVVNTIGIFREQGAQRFATLHDAAPRALFDACVQRGVRRVVQLSALGVEQELTEFQRSKLAADRHLLALPLEGIVARPSLVFGPGGTSARAFLQLAAAPLLLLPAGGVQRIQPIHVDDAVAALCALVEAPAGRWAGHCVPLVGPREMTLREYLETLRRDLQLAPAPVLALPAPLVGLAARIGERRSASLLDRASWAMLQQGNVASADRTAWLLARKPLDARDFLRGQEAGALRRDAQLGWLLPLLRVSLALVWIVTAVLSFGVYPREASYELLARTGVPAALQPLMLVGAAGLDLVFGVLTLAPPHRRRNRRALWVLQGALMVFYMVVIAVRLPEFWLHPYGPLLKNLPMLAALVALWTLDDDTNGHGGGG